MARTKQTARKSTGGKAPRKHLAAFPATTKQGIAGKGLAGEGLAGIGQPGQSLAGKGLAGKGLAGKGLAGKQLAGKGLAGSIQPGQGFGGKGFAGKQIYTQCTADQLVTVQQKGKGRQKGQGKGRKTKKQTADKVQETTSSFPLFQEPVNTLGNISSNFQQSQCQNTTPFSFNQDVQQNLNSFQWPEIQPQIYKVYQFTNLNDLHYAGQATSSQQTQEVSCNYPLYSQWENDLDDWTDFLERFLAEGKLLQIYQHISQIYQKEVCFPAWKDMFNCFQLTKHSNVKVVIIGQDPYIDENQAMGLSFSVPAGQKVPPSLKNIYKTIKNDYPNFNIPNHGDLSSWAKQGVLLLNSVLTVQKKKSNSHAKKYGWEQFTDFVIQRLNEEKSNLVFLLWGTPAQQKGKIVDRNRHLVLEACHPSPLSASSGGFFNCQHFKQCNDYLSNHSIKEISWDLD